MCWGEKLSWVKQGAENIFLKKIGAIAVALGIILAILIVHQYTSMVKTTQYTSNIATTHCDTNNDCVICDGSCKSTIGSVCSSMVFSTSCQCVNHTCTKVLNES